MKLRTTNESHTALEMQILWAAYDENHEAFTRLAHEYGGLANAQALVRASGIMRRPMPLPRLKTDASR